MCIHLLLSIIIVSMFHDPKLPIPSFVETSTLTLTLITHPSLIIFHDDDVSNLWTQIPAGTTTTLLANNITRCHCCTWTTCMLLLLHPIIWGFHVIQSCNVFQLMFWGFEMRKKSFLLIVILLLLGFGLLEVVEVVALLLLQEGYHHCGLFSTLQPCLLLL